VVDVEQRTLGPLEQDLRSLTKLVVDEEGGVDEVGFQPLPEGQVFVERLLEIDLLRAEVILQEEVLHLEVRAQLRREDLRADKVADADADAGHLVS